MLDTNDLAAITEIVHGAFADIPLKVVAGLNEGQVQYTTLYAAGNVAWSLRIMRIGSAIRLEWLDSNSEMMAHTILRGI